MFYLIHFLKLFKTNFIRAFLYFLLSCLVVISFGVRPIIDKKITNHLVDDTDGAYFYSLISSAQDHKGLAMKLRELPGVKKIESFDHQTIEKESRAFLDALQIEGGSDLISVDYVGHKVVFEKDVSPRTVSLIREYIVRFIGENNITLGPIKYPIINKEKLNTLDSLKEYSSIFLIAISVVFWVIAVFVLYPVLNHLSYMVENFQRRRLVAFKSWTFFNCVLLVCVVSISLQFDLDFYHLMYASTLIFLSSFIVFKKTKWRSR